MSESVLKEEVDLFCCILISFADSFSSMIGFLIPWKSCLLAGESYLSAATILGSLISLPSNMSIDSWFTSHSCLSLSF